MQRGRPEYPRYTTVRLVDPGSGRETRRFAVPDDEGYDEGSFSFSPDGRTLAMIGGKHVTLYLWEVATGCQRARLTEFPGLLALAFSPDGRTLALGDAKVIRLVDVAIRKERQSLAGFPGHHHSGAGPLAFSPDGKI